jgi:hypothetical protein
MSTAQAKFRPSLTLDEINRILSLLDPIHDKAIITQLNKFRLKAIHGIATPSHVVVPRQSLEDSLGFGSQSTTSNEQSAEQLYKIWCDHPQTLSATQLEKVHHYRYTNDMMTPEEESNYELGM